MSATLTTLTHTPAETTIFTQPLRKLFSLSIVLALFAFGMFPFQLRGDLGANGAARTSDGGLRLAAPGIARTWFAPRWLSQAIQRNELEVRLNVRPTGVQAQGIARIFTNSSGYGGLRNLTIAQSGSAMFVSVRTAEGPDVEPWVIDDVFHSASWHDIRLAIADEELIAEVNRETRLRQILPASPMTHWNNRYPVALGNELTGDRAWLGDISRASIRVGQHEVDLLDASTLYLPARLRDMSMLAQSLTQVDLTDCVVNLFGFVLAGFALAYDRRGMGLMVTVLLCSAISLSIELGQTFIQARFPSVVDWLLNSLGGGIGAFLARRGSEWLPRARQLTSLRAG